MKLLSWRVMKLFSWKVTMPMFAGMKLLSWKVMKLFSWKVTRMREDALRIEDADMSGNAAAGLAVLKAAPAGGSLAGRATNGDVAGPKAPQPWP